MGFVIEDIEPSAAVDPGRDMVNLYGYASMAVAGARVSYRLDSAPRPSVDRDARWRKSSLAGLVAAARRPRDEAAGATTYAWIRPLRMA